MFEELSILNNGTWWFTTQNQEMYVVRCGNSFAAFCLVSILASRGPVSILAQEWAIIFRGRGQIDNQTHMSIK